MKNLQNLHIHSTFCDGKDSIETIAKKAYELGFESIGFSSHSYMPFSKVLSLKPEKIPDYLSEIKKIGKIYEGKMNIYSGIEFEMLCDTDLSAFQYVIGSCHYFHIGDEYVGFDRSPEEIQRVIDTYFDGNGLKFAEKYYETLSNLPKIGKTDIIGHFDLITKHSENYGYLDTESREYKKYVTDAIDSLVGKIPLLEINTGGISRGYRKKPYPSEFILKEWKSRGGVITVSSDCHNCEFLLTGYADAFALAESVGYHEIYIFDGRAFVPKPIPSNC